MTLLLVHILPHNPNAASSSFPISELSRNQRMLALFLKNHSADVKTIHFEDSPARFDLGIFVLCTNVKKVEFDQTFHADSVWRHETLSKVTSLARTGADSDIKDACVQFWSYLRSLR